jgi:hypothetical protein
VCELFLIHYSAVGRACRKAGTPEFIGPAAERVTFDDLAALYLNDYRVNGRRSMRRR